MITGKEKYLKRMKNTSHRRLKTKGVNKYGKKGRDYSKK